MHDINTSFFKPTVSADGSSRRTKIVNTLGPTSESVEMISAMIEAGMDFARFNTKHNEPQWHLERIQRVRKIAKEMNHPIPILLDLQGPEVRITVINGSEFEVEKGGNVIFTSVSQHDAPNAVFVPQEVITGLHAGDLISIADGTCVFKVTRRDENEIHAQAEDDVTVKTRKTLNTPGVVLDMPSLLDKDISFLDALKADNPEIVGLSFVRDLRDIAQLRQALAARNMSSAICAKIENQKAIENMDEIIQGSDLIMVARGDLGVEIPFYEVPHWQKVLINKCKTAGKPVITATQMLLSMTQNPIPTRAEVSDVANAVYDGSTAVMTSEETAQGKYPLKTVQTQVQIIMYHEQFAYTTQESK